MEEMRRLFMIELNDFHITSTNPIHMNSTCPFDNRTSVIEFIYSERSISWKSTCVMITRPSNLCMTWYFFRVAYTGHVFRCSSHIPEIPPTCPEQSVLTATAISSPPGGLSDISSVRTRIGIGSISGGCCMQRSSL